MTALVGAAKNAITSIVGLAESTREYRSIMASLENSSARAGYSVDETANTFKQLNGVLGDTQSAATTTANLQAIGLEQSKLTNLTNGVIGAWAKYGDSIPIDGLSEAVNHTIQLGSTQGTLADVLEWSGTTVEDFDAKLAKCDNETERANLIQKLFAEQGLTEAGKAWQDNNKSIVDANNAQAEYEKNTATLGEKIEPITTKVREGFNKILEKILELVEGVDLDAFGEKISKAFDKFINDILPKIVDGLTWIIDNKDIIIAGIVGIGAAFAAFKVVTLIQSVVGALKGMTAAQAALNLVMSMNPIGLVVAAVAGLVAAFVVLWKKCDGFREFWIGLWDGIKNVAKAVGDWFVQAFTAVGKFFSDLWAGIKTGASNLWNGIKNIFSTVSNWFNTKVIQPVKNVFTGLWNGLKNGASQAWNGIKSVFSKVATFFKDIFSKAWQGVKNVFSTGGKIFDGIKDGIASAFKNIVNAIIKGINKVVSVPFKAINKVLGKVRNVSIAGISPFKNLISNINAPQIPLLAKGGIVRKATNAIIGEDGAEAVMPLEKNTGWIKQLAKEIAAELGQGVVVNQTNNYSQAHSRYELWKSEQNIKSAVKLGLLGGF